MLTLILYFALMFITILFMVHNYCEFRNTRDSAYAAFFGIAAALVVCMTYGFLHFKPWLLN